MRIQAFVTPLELNDVSIKGRSAVVIDVLRATTSIVHAKSNGAEKVIPTATIEAATRLATTLDRATTLLCGEREGRRIDGFNLGNSPREYSAEAVQGKTLVMTTTNGTETIARLEGAREIVVCSFANVSAVASYLAAEADVAIACSGRAGHFSLEDAVCAGLLVARLREQVGRAVERNDGAIAAEGLYDVYERDLVECLMESAHGRFLTEIGFGEDVVTCARVDTLTVVPVVREGRIV